jgi:hypothetical protein
LPRKAASLPRPVKDLIQSLFDPEYPLHELPVDASIAEQMSSVGRDGTPLQSACDQQGPENPSVTHQTIW